MSELLVSGIRKSYPTPAEPLVVLDGVDLTLRAGESLAVLGPSGSGKSTLLAILGALDEPTDGSVRLDDVDPFTLSENKLAAFRADAIGFVFQEHYLLPQCTVLENVLVPMLSDGAAASDDSERARGLLARVGLSERLTHRPAQLSGGERQRVAIARALVRGPKLLLADEPTGNLDARTAEAVGDLLLELVADSQTMLVAVTHSAEFAGRMGRQAHWLTGVWARRGERELSCPPQPIAKSRNFEAGLRQKCRETTTRPTIVVGGQSGQPVASLPVHQGLNSDGSVAD